MNRGNFSRNSFLFNYFSKYLVFFSFLFILTGCVGSKIDVLLNEGKSVFKDVSSLFNKGASYDKNFGVDGQFNLSAFSKTISHYTDLNVRKIHSDNNQGVYLELGSNNFSNKIIKLDSQGNLDKNFKTVLPHEGLSRSTNSFSILTVLADGSFFTTGHGVKDHCPNYWKKEYKSCTVIKKYLSTGELDKSFASSGIIDVLDKSNFDFGSLTVENLFVLSNNDIFILGRHGNNFDLSNRYFKQINSVTGEVLYTVPNFTFSRVNHGEKFISIKELASGSLQLISYSDNTIFKTNLIFTYPNGSTPNVTSSYSSVSFSSKKSDPYFVTDDNVVFIRNNSSLDSKINTIPTSASSQVYKYNIANNTLSNNNITNPFTGNSSNIVSTSTAYNITDNSFLVFSFVDNGSGEISKIASKFNIADFSLDVNFQSLGIHLFNQQFDSIAPQKFLSTANTQFVYEVENDKSNCALIKECLKTFSFNVYTHNATLKSGKNTSFQVPEYLKFNDDPRDVVILRNGEILIHFIKANSDDESKHNSNYFMKFSSDGKTIEKFGNNGVLRFANSLVQKVIYDKDGNFYVLYFIKNSDNSLNLYVSKINSLGKFDSSFGIDGSLLITENLKNVGFSFSDEFSKFELFNYSVIATIKLNNLFINLSTPNHFNNYNLDLISKKLILINSFPSNIIDQVLEGLYPEYNDYKNYSITDYYISSETGDLYIAVFALVNTRTDSQLNILKLSPDGSVDTQFANNGILTVYERKDYFNNPFDPTYFSVLKVDNKLQIISSIIDYSLGYIDGVTEFSLFDLSTNKLAGVHKLRDSEDSSYILNNYISLDSNTALFSALKLDAQTQAYPNPEDLTFVLSYLSILENSITYKEIPWDKKEANAIGFGINKVFPYENNLYLLLSKNIGAYQTEYLFVKLKER